MKLWTLLPKEHICMDCINLKMISEGLWLLFSSSLEAKNSHSRGSNLRNTFVHLVPFVVWLLHAGFCGRGVREKAGRRSFPKLLRGI